MSDQYPPGGLGGGPGGASGGGPEEERPPALIPSRAARHQAKRGRLFRGRGARKGPEPPARPPQEPPARRGPEPSGRRGPEPSRWPGPDPSGAPPGPEALGRAPEPPGRRRPDILGRQRPEPSGRPGREPRVRPVPDLPAGKPSGARARPREDPGRRPGLKAPQLRPPRPADLRGSSLGLAGTLIAVVTVLVLAVNALPSAKPPAAPAARDPYSARWVCPLLPGQTTSVTVANVGNAAASLRTTVREAGTKAQPATKQLAGGAIQKLSLTPRNPGFVQVEAFSAPVVVSAPGLGCAPGPGNRWWLPASDTRFGSDTRVLIANPDNQPAVVDLVPHLTSGSIRPDEREVFIQPGETVVRPLGDEAPAGLKPSIEVVARAGRVVAGATVSTGGKQPTLLPAQGTAQPAWSFAGGVSGGGSQTQVLVTNPNPTPLQVDVRVTTAKATFRPPGEFGEPIPNGGTAELAIPALDVAGPFAVHVRSVNGAAFVAALRVTQGDGSQTTSRFDLGTGQSERNWLVPGAPAGGQLVLANLSPDELEARLGDLTASGGAGAGQPVRLPPGRVAVKKVPAGVDNLVVQAGSAGLVAAPLNGGPIIPGSAIGGLPAGGPITPGPAAAP